MQKLWSATARRRAAGRQFSTALILVLGYLFFTACASPPPPPPPTPDPRIDELQRSLENVGTAVEGIALQVERLERTPTPTATPVPTPSPTATPVPTPTPTPGLSQAEADEVEQLVQSRITAAIAAIPTPEPTATALPTPTPISLPALLALVPQVSGTASISIKGTISLSVEPGQPLAGRNIAFTLRGLRPWQQIEVEFADPRGEPVEWITSDEANFARTNNVPVTKNRLYADSSGQASWLRIGTRDIEGVWAVRVILDGQATSVTYPVSQLQLPISGVEQIGVEFRRYQGAASNTYFSALVPAALAVDLQAHLAWTVDKMRNDLGIQSGHIPDVFLAGNHSLFEEAARAVDIEVGFEDGFFLPGTVHRRPGVYMRVDFLPTSVQETLTHEYVHLVLDELAGSSSLPAWLNEGMAGFIQYELGRSGQRPDVTRRRLFASTDLATSVVQSGSVQLSSLESQSAWNAQRNEELIDLQYAVAQMAARFLAETYGPKAGVEVVKSIAAGHSLSDALVQVTAQSYPEFQAGFNDWLKSWEDPERADVRLYVQDLQDVLDAADLIVGRRDQANQSNFPLPQLAPTYVEIVADALALEARLKALSHPVVLDQLHLDALAYLDSLVKWLTLQREYARTEVDARRVEANDMIPEVDGREGVLKQEVRDVEYSYRL